MVKKTTNSYRFSWQMILSWWIGLISLITIVIINMFPLEQLRNPLWRYSISVVFSASILVLLNAAFRERIIRRKVAWIFMSTASFLLACKPILRSLNVNNDIFIVIGVFVFTILGLIVYFPKSVWSLGNIERVVCDILLLSFSVISLIQSGIYCSFGVNELSTTAASYSIWVGFEIAGLINTIFLWYYYRQRILVLIVLAAICIVAADVTGTARQWYSGIYRISGLPELAMNYLQTMIVMIFAYYSVDHFIDFPSYEHQIISKFEWYYRTGVPVLAFIVSLAVTLFVHAPDRWVTQVLFGVALVQMVVSNREEYRLIERLYQANRKLTAVNAELRAAQARLRQAMFDAEELAVQEERRRLALEIHDGMGHHLTNAMSFLALVADMLEEDIRQVRRYLAIASEQVEQAHTDLYRSLHALTSVEIITQPLETWLHGLVRECIHAGIRTELTVAGTPRTLPPNLQHALYRVAQEAVTNLQKYAHATSVLIEVAYSDSTIRLCIQDNGVGFAMPAEPRGRGLTNMRARIEHLGGVFQIDSGPEQGVTVCAQVPLAV